MKLKILSSTTIEFTSNISNIQWFIGMFTIKIYSFHCELKLKFMLKSGVGNRETNVDRTPYSPVIAAALSLSTLVALHITQLSMLRRSGFSSSCGRLYFSGYTTNFKCCVQHGCRNYYDNAGEGWRS